MSASKKQKTSHCPLEKSRGEKRNRFIEIFIKKIDWQDEDLLAFINDEFDNNVEDINWILKTAVESELLTDNVVDVLMKNGTELHVLNDLGQTAIHIAAMNKESTATYSFLNYFGDENISDNEGFTYFHVACMYDFVELVQKFIDQGVDVNLTFYKEGRRVSPLSLCIEHGSPITLRFLLNNGADLNIYDDWNEEPLSCLKRIKRDLMYENECMWKIIANHHFKELLKQTTALEIIENRSDNEGFTYLHAACMSGSIEMVQKFIDRKNDLDLIWCLGDGTKESPLTLATEFKRIEIVEMLLKNGANPNMKQLGKNPLHVFFTFFVDKEEDSSLLDLLIRYNCDVNEKDNDGSSPMFLCFKNCDGDLRYIEGSEFHKLFINRISLETLLKNKADINEVFENGQSILHLFINSHVCRDSEIDMGMRTERNTLGIELIKTLLKYGANVNAKDDSGNSPLNLAVLSCNLEVVEELFAHGADVESVDFSKLYWEYDWSIYWLHKMIKFFLILHCLNDNGYKMNESSFLAVSKFLVNEIYHSELWNEWERKIYVGSTNQIRSLLTSIKNRREGDELDEYEKRRFAHLIYQQLQTIEKGNMFTTAEMKDCLQQLQTSYLLEEEDICRIDTEISNEIENIKKLEIKKGLSLLDVCSSSPGKAYYLLKNSNFWEVIDSEKFEDDFIKISDTIRGYIIKCFMRKFFMDFGLKYLTLLMQGKLPILCCEHLIQYLNYEDILNLCEAYVNKK